MCVNFTSTLVENTRSDDDIVAVLYKESDLSRIAFRNAYTGNFFVAGFTTETSLSSLKKKENCTLVYIGEKVTLEF